MHVGVDLLFLAPGESGGRETYARELLPALRAQRPDLRLTAFVGREAAGGEGWWSAVVDRTVVVRGSSARSPARWALGEAVLLPVAARRAGVDLLHSVANFAPLAGPTPRVVTVHDLIFRRLPDTVPTALRLGTEALVPPAARRARRVITVSAASGRDLVDELGLDPERVDVVPNGIAPAAPGADGRRARARLAIPAARSVALCVAGAVAHKNLGALVDAVALLAPADRPVLVLAGHGTDAGPLPARAAAAGVGDDVRCVGAVPQPELEDLYAAASMLVTATRYEGFGLPVLEAMLRDVPVACSDIPVLREVAGDAATYFDPGSPAAIAGALRLVLGGGSAIEGLRRRGRERALGYTWAAAAAGTAASYERALAPRRR